MASVTRIYKLFIGIILLIGICMWNFFPRKKSFLSGEMSFSSRSCSHLKLFNLTYNKTNGSDFIRNRMDKIHTVFEQMDNASRDEKNSIISFLSQPIINNHNFHYVHNPDSACLDFETEVLIAVPSAPDNFKKRLNMRNGDSGNYIKNTSNKAKLLFFIGRTKINETQKKIDEESNTFKDIVQESFEDNYHNIRFKAVSMLKWASSLCQQASYVIRNDDDITMNLTSVVETVKRTRLKYANFILGRLRFNDIPARNVNNKVYLSKQEYPDPTFPPFALGGLLGYPMLTVQLLYQAALRVQPIWLDDVFITGICAPKVGVKLLSDSTFVFKHEYS